MSIAIKIDAATVSHISENKEQSFVQKAVSASWQKIAPFWPLKNLIAVNPLQGFEDLPIERALADGNAYFQRAELPQPMQAVNRETIKWCQAFFDDGQATIAMPDRHLGLLTAWRNLVVFDDQLLQNDPSKKAWLTTLPASAELCIAECLLKLSIPREQRVEFLTLLLTTLPGWAAHIKYRTAWTAAEPTHAHKVTEADYLAMRLITTCLLWPDAAQLLKWQKESDGQELYAQSIIAKLEKAETAFRTSLLQQLASTAQTAPVAPDAQLVFCIDVRSEPFRRALEQTGKYETYGFAGFFGVAARIQDDTTGEDYASCPVLLAPKHIVHEKPACGHSACQKDKAGYARVSGFKRLYQSVKYNFTAPFALVDTLGPLTGLWMGLRNSSPKLSTYFKGATTQMLRTAQPVATDISSISLAEQCTYAAGALRMMGLTRNFAPLVVFCGHGSSTQNNAFATALDCGACGGRHGASNARILANILNNPAVRQNLIGCGITIPAETCFIAAEHNTTTDAVELFAHEPAWQDKLATLKTDLDFARVQNSQFRAAKMNIEISAQQSAAEVARRSMDWAQVRPEWGLARNAAFIVAPRSLTRDLALEGRCFLHSYDWQQDMEGASLTVILTAPMVVAQWINSQYLFSTIDNVAYGAGSKVTKNITGKIGIMQGNGSDLMHGLPLQSVNSSDIEAYHEPQRLLTVVCAPRTMIDDIIAQQDVLKKLFGNGWVQLACIDPISGGQYYLQRDLSWQKAS